MSKCEVNFARALTPSWRGMESELSHSYILYRYNPSVFLGEAFYDWRKYVFQEFANYLCSCGLSVKIEDKESFDVILGPFEKKPVVIRDSLAIIQNDQTGDYYVLDCHDMVKTDELELILRDSRCKRILKCQYRAALFKDGVYQKIRPWTYFDRFWPKNEKRLVAAREFTRTSDSLYFRGADWAKRRIILEVLSKKKGDKFRF